MRKRRPQVAIATRLYPPEVSAASFRMQAVAEALSEDGPVRVISAKLPRGLADTTQRPSLDVRRFPVLRDRSGAIRGYLQYLSFDIPAAFRLLASRAAVFVAEAPPTTGVVTALAAAILRRTFVYYPGDVWTDGVIAMGAPRPVVFAMRAMETFVLRRANLIFAVSPEVSERLEALGADPERITMVGNGVDTTEFHPAVATPPVAKPYFVYTGTMSEWQAPDVFIRALALVDADVELRFFGQGALEADLKALADRLVPGRVHFGGVVSPAASASWIRGAVAALVSIVPGIGYDFARPTKTYAAAACGTPVLFTGADTGGEVVRSGDLGHAVAFAPEDVAQAMSALYAASTNGDTERLRTTRSEWVGTHYSLHAAGRRARDSIRAYIERRAHDR